MLEPAIAKGVVVTTPDTLSTTGWLFVRVIVAAALVVPTTVLANDSELGATATGARPVPDKLTVWLPKSSVIVIVPFCVPSVVGCEAIFSLQEALAASTVPHVEVGITANCPVGTTLAIFSGIVWLFVTVTDDVALT